MTLASIYPLYVSKVEKKGRSEEELLEVIQWLTGYSKKDISRMIKEETTFDTFFNECSLNQHAHLITGSICGYKVQDLEDPFIQKTRYLDKPVDELAKGKPMEKILRTP